jgi:hypothetical protein
VPYPLPVIAEPSIFIAAQTETDEKHERDERNDNDEWKVFSGHLMAASS